jgi:hypothetical protein
MPFKPSINKGRSDLLMGVACSLQDNCFDIYPPIMLAISKWSKYRPEDGHACSLQNQLSEFYF